MRKYIIPIVETVPVHATNCLCGSATLSIKTNNTPQDFTTANTGR